MSGEQQKEADSESKAVSDADKQGQPQARMVTVSIMGKPAQVPEDATIMRAIEHSGQQIIRGAGCREGFCGACGTIYRLPGDYRIHTGLACTTLVQDGMALSQIPSVPLEKAVYDLEELTPDVDTIKQLYPATFRCVACGTCTKACPQGLQVMDYIQAAMRGDIAELMELSYDCVACGLCALRCPAEIIQHKVGILGKRLYGRYLRKESKELDSRLQQMKDGEYNGEYAELMSLDREALSERYYARDME
ncbi:4Fe-4S dicluster domain-containing protein [endosymbiont of Ridgeia piscesae]|jgi:succinate dehydrogenase/fumarate reductase-like Fe-S protein|uniref:4Fe-4S dicluster domain n=1 Tax=endosymbiont of Ridgeia piscesae TaxID=54398 RepID=A0A0T5Z170_9GAMM|nr:4Fe-4S dicluster domain-containing protein [endosymbiont of Ridgeia piscesae]KRT56254.1 4Fe-4S dicluster domain [endosymbiont of Ridgeia piscesae]KRT59976.1 4Fe-4S dicluster domain-containing protein [endosymbiont of Ridgeia piscesae]